MEGGATTPHPSSSCLYHEALLSHVARSRGKISRTSTRAVKRPTHMGASQLIEQVRACGEGAVKTPAPRTLRAMGNFAIKKSPPHGLSHARGGCPHAYVGVGLRLNGSLRAYSKGRIGLCDEGWVVANPCDGTAFRTLTLVHGFRRTRLLSERDDRDRCHFSKHVECVRSRC